MYVKKTFETLLNLQAIFNINKLRCDSYDNRMSLIKKNALTEGMVTYSSF